LLRTARHSQGAIVPKTTLPTTIFLSLTIRERRSSFSYLGGLYVPMVVLAVIGFVGWIAPYFVYEHARRSKTIQTAPKIEEQYELVYQLCKQAKALRA
jgi:hypothetical protein